MSRKCQSCGEEGFNWNSLKDSDHILHKDGEQDTLALTCQVRIIPDRKELLLEAILDVLKEIQTILESSSSKRGHE